MEGRYSPMGPWRCFKCTLVFVVNEMQELAEHRGPHYEKCVAAGTHAAMQVKARTGPIYDRWARGMRASIPLLLDATMGAD